MTAEKLFNRKEAAGYLTERGFPISPKTLRNMAAKNTKSRVKGPPLYRMMTRTIYYRQSDLDTWAASNTRRIE